MTAAGCPRCQRATTDGLLCASCVGVFERAVADLGVLLPELAVTVGKRDEVARAIRHRHRELEVVEDPEPIVYALANHGAPVNLDAVEAAGSVRVTLSTWVAHLRSRYGDPDGWSTTIAAHRPLLGPVCRGACSHGSCIERRSPSFPAAARAVTVAGPECHAGLACGHRSCLAVRAGRVDVTAWLLASVAAVRRDDAARAIVVDLVSAARRVEAIVDRRDPEVYVGPCDAPDVAVTLEDGTIALATGRICGVDLYARFGEKVASCGACGARYRVSERKEWLLEAAREVWARPALIATALAALDVDLTAGRLDQWISRDKRRHARCWPGVECGHIVAVALDSAEVNEKGEPVGRPMYRVGTVLDRVEALRAAKAEQLERQEAAG